jgi:carbonic anhydrase
MDLAKTTIVQNAWKNNQVLHLHGWVYNIGTGLIEDQNVNLVNNNSLEERFRITNLWRLSWFSEICV